MLGHGAVYVLGTMLQSGLGLMLLPAVTRILGVEQFGLAGTATALAAMLAIVYALGINFAIVRFYFDDPPDATHAGWAALLRLQVGVAAVLAIVTYVTGPLWSQAFRDFGWEPAMKVAVVYGLATAIQTTAQGILRSARRPGAFVAVSLIQLLTGAGLGLFLATKYGAAGYVGGLTIGSLAAALLALSLNYRRPRWDRDLLKSGVRVSLPFMLHSLATWGLEISNRLFVAFFLGLAAVGRFQVAYLLGSALILLLTGIQAAWAPFFLGELSPEERRSAPPRIVIPVTAVVLGVAAIVVLCSPVLLHVVAPEGARGTNLIVALVASASLARAGYLVSVVVLLDQKRTGVLSRASALGAIMNVGLNIALIPRIGVEAAAVGIAVGAMLQASVVLKGVARQLDASMHLPSLVVLWGMGTGVLVALSQLPTSAAGLVVRAVLVVVALAFCWSNARLLRQGFRAGVQVPQPI